MKEIKEFSLHLNVLALLHTKCYRVRFTPHFFLRQLSNRVIVLSFISLGTQVRRELKLFFLEHFLSTMK